MLSEGEHIFSKHLLQKQNSGLVINTADDLIWPSFFLFICLILLALIKASSIEKVIRIIQSTFNKQVLLQLEREEFNPYKFYALALNLFFLLNISFLVYKINVIYQFILPESSHLIQFSFFLIIITLIYFLKSLLNGLIAFFTNEGKIISGYVTRSVLINQAFGLFLFPLIVLLEFSTYNPVIFISLALVVFSVSLILKWYRGLIRALLEERVGLLQILAYFCGLEILPVFVLVKFVIETF